MTQAVISPREHALGVIARRVPNDFSIDFDFEPSAELKKRLQAYYHEEQLDLILDRLGVEFRNTVVFTSAGVAGVDIDSRLYRSGWGVSYDRHLGAVVDHPLRDATHIKELDSYAYLDPDAVDYDAIEQKAQRYDKSGSYCVYGGFWAPITYIAQQLVGMDRYMMLFYDDLPLIEHLLDIITNIALEINTRIFDRLGSAMHVYFMGDDYGTQLNLMTSLDFWRVLIKPRLKRIIDHAKARGYFVQFHSCGSVSALIPDFVDLGVDVLNPIQVAAQHMVPKELITQYGQMISFNGGIDTQQLLPFGSPQDVRKTVRETIVTLSQYGGYVLGPSQSFLPDIPIENIVAMYEEAMIIKQEGI